MMEDFVGRLLVSELICTFLFIFFSWSSSQSKKYINTKQSNKKNNQISKDKRQDYNMK